MPEIEYFFKQIHVKIIILNQTSELAFLYESGCYVCIAKNRSFKLIIYSFSYSLMHMDVSSFFFTQQSNLGLGRLTVEVSNSHTTDTHTRQDSSVRVISTSQEPIPTHHTKKQNRRICILLAGSNTQFQQSRSRRPMPQTAWSLGSVVVFRIKTNIGIVLFLHDQIQPCKGILCKFITNYPLALRQCINWALGLEFQKSGYPYENIHYRKILPSIVHGHIKRYVCTHFSVTGGSADFISVMQSSCQSRPLQENISPNTIFCET